MDDDLILAVTDRNTTAMGFDAGMCLLLFSFISCPTETSLEITIQIETTPDLTPSMKYRNVLFLSQPNEEQYA